MANYYKTIGGKKYDRKLLDLADSVSSGQGDGRISIKDAKLILKEVLDANDYTEIEKITVEYIRKNYKFTKAADDLFRTEIRRWAATKKNLTTKADSKKKDSSHTEPKMGEIPTSRKWIFIFLFLLVLLLLGILIYQGYCPKKKSPVPITQKPQTIETQTKAVDDKMLLESKALLFPKNNRSLHDEKTKETILQVAEILKKNPDWKITIQGHTCNEDKSGANQRISKQRAQLVRDELVRLGIAQDRLKTEGLADTQPIASNDTPDGRSKNRRVVFKIQSN